MLTTRELVASFFSRRVMEWTPLRRTTRTARPCSQSKANGHLVSTHIRPASDHLRTHTRPTTMNLPAAQRAVLTRIAEPGHQTWSLDVAYPVPSPSAGQVLVKVSHAGLNPFDWQSVEYKFGITKDPKVIGRDGAGIVVQVGTEVSRFREGDRVSSCGWQSFSPN